MCRHLAYLGPTVPLADLLGRELPHGLYAQSWAPRKQRFGKVNADGFGIGWYPPEDGATPARYRRAVPIWADPDLPDLARCLTGTAALAAVRDASVGSSPDASAVAPYRADPWLFSLNGAVPDWPELPADLGIALEPAELLQLEARCDTALLWVLVLRLLRDGAAPDSALAEVVRHTMAARPQARVNLLLTDGQTIAATRCGDSLWYRVGRVPSAPSRRPDPVGAGGGVLVASEPVDDADGWHEVPQHSVLLATRAAVRVVPLTLAATSSQHTSPRVSDTVRPPSDVERSPT